MRARFLPLCCVLSLVLPASGLADDNADAKPILDKALKAMGGEVKVAKLKTGAWKGKITLQEGGQQIIVILEATQKGLEKYRMDADVTVNGMSNKALLVIDGDKGWIKGGDNTQEAPKGVVPFVKDLFFAMRAPQLLADLRGKEFELAPLGELKVGDKPAVGIRITRKGRPEVRLLFDKDKGLPLQSEVRLTSPDNKEITLECNYDEYKDFDGLKHPVKMTIKADGKDFAVEVESVTADDVDDSQFGKP